MRNELRFLKQLDEVEPCSLSLLSFNRGNTIDIIDIILKCINRYNIEEEYIINNIMDNNWDLNLGLMITNDPIGMIVELDGGSICNHNWDILADTSAKVNEGYSGKLREYLYNIYYKGWNAHISTIDIVDHIEEGVYHFSNMIYGKTSLKEVNRIYNDFIYKLKN